MQRDVIDLTSSSTAEKDEAEDIDYEVELNRTQGIDDDDERLSYDPESPSTDRSFKITRRDEEKMAEAARSHSMEKMHKFFQDARQQKLTFAEFFRTAYGPTWDDVGYSMYASEVLLDLKKEFTILFQRHVRGHYPDIDHAIRYIYALPPKDNAVLKAWIRDSKPFADKTSALYSALIRIYKGAPRLHVSTLLYRGIGSALGDTNIANISVQREQLMSTTWTKSIARSFGSDLLLEITVPAKVSFLLLETRVFNEYGFKDNEFGLGGEQEILLPPGLLLRNTMNPWKIIFVANPDTFNHGSREEGKDDAGVIDDYNRQRQFFDVALYLSAQREHHIKLLYKRVKKHLSQYRKEVPGYWGENTRLRNVTEAVWLWFIRKFDIGTSHVRLRDTWRELHKQGWSSQQCVDSLYSTIQLFYLNWISYNVETSEEEYRRGIAEFSVKYLTLDEADSTVEQRQSASSVLKHAFTTAIPPLATVIRGQLVVKGFVNAVDADAA